MIVAASFTTIFTLLIFFFIVPDPEDIGIIVEEMTEKEALIASASEKEVFDRIIAKKVASPQEIIDEIKTSTIY